MVGRFLPPAPSGNFARFDDLRAGFGLVFGAPRAQALAAFEPVDVQPLLREVEKASAAGLWAVGFVSYEAAAGLGPALAVRRALPGEPCGELPLAWFSFFAAPRRVRALGGGLGRSMPYSVAPWEPDWSQDAYRRKVEAVRERIAAGDTYQCNLTVRLRSSAEGDLQGLYRDLAMAQRGPYNAYLDTGRFVVVSASPELFFEWRGQWLTARPMKGTAPRGRFLDEDEQQAAKLARSGKDRAENVMIVDLVRSDLGRLAEWGSVDVVSLFELERYETVWQLTSTVRARARPGTTLVGLFEALFPSGSVTGAPKPSTMALIAQLEESRRGAYCGAVGIVAPARASFRARFNVAIRTIVVGRATGDDVYGAGGGITWASTAEAEHAELLAKSAVLFVPAEEFELFETMGYWPGEGLRNLDRHLERLGSSARYFGFRFDVAATRAALEVALTDRCEARRVKLLLSRSGAVQVQSTSMPAAPDRPLWLAIDCEPVDSSSVWLYHKTTRRSAYEARAARHPEADDVVLVNERGELTEATTANLAVCLGGQWWTPPVGSGCLPGVERARLVEQGRLAERALRRDDLYGAEGIALVSSLRGWRPAAFNVPVTSEVHGPVTRTAP